MKKVKAAPRRQCKLCPWKKGAKPKKIPGEYCELKHRALTSTIAKPGEISFRLPPMMACHETHPGRELPCVGWLVHQLGPGNNIALRMAVLRGVVDARVVAVGPQHERFEDTLP